jgi:hypothetical protein
MNTLKTVFGKLFKEETQLASHEVELALAEDLRKAENDFKTAILQFGDIKEKYTMAKNNLEKQGDNAYNVADKYMKAAQELGLKPMDNVLFKTIDSYLMSDVWRNRNK